jgi:hypothetical protein
MAVGTNSLETWHFGQMVPAFDTFRRYLQPCGLGLLNHLPNMANAGNRAEFGGIFPVDLQFRQQHLNTTQLAMAERHLGLKHQVKTHRKG